MTLAEVLASRKHVLLDFDGPVCAVFGGAITDRDAADELKPLLGSDVPQAVAAAHDPFDVLRYASTRGAAAAGRVEARFRELEVAAVASAPEAPCAHATIQSIIDSGRTVAIVSNNSTEAVRRYLAANGLTPLVPHVSARESADAGLLKPAPFLLREAMNALNAQPSTCVMIGDSETDVDAARASGTAVIGYANKPGKRDRLANRGADAVIDRLIDLA